MKKTNIQEFALVCAFGVCVINFSLNCFYKLEFALKKKKKVAVEHSFYLFSPS